MKYGKNILALALVLALTMGALPQAALAEEPTETTAVCTEPVETTQIPETTRRGIRPGDQAGDCPGSHGGIGSRTHRGDYC